MRSPTTARSGSGVAPNWRATRTGLRPEHLVVETFSAVRGRHLGSKISRRRAQDALDALASSTIELLSTTFLLPRMWQLRENLTGYDAAYVAAAEAYDCPLLTADARLTRVGDLRCEISLVVHAG